ncbi:hypothetical protein BEN71_13790 [Acinetobacter wuhouensis]|uniref:hypothetical protein n=1 Tax=Acinetobacter wuhouensis TaxID=1879050 RepID=UPI00083AAD50|nr:hypothetical protein [Acinetobacter wuhouensis]AXQ23081.1 hypothetical protein BEN71_13790 [Acinetobacter wuhouensis]
MKIKNLFNSTLLLCLLLPTALYFTVLREGIITFSFGLFLCFCSYSIFFYSQNKKRPADLSTNIISSFAFVAPILFLGIWAQMTSLTSRNFETYLQQHQCESTKKRYKYTVSKCENKVCKSVPASDIVYYCDSSQESMYETKYKELYGPKYGIWDDQLD